jgi:hypothetical protein
MALAVDQNSLTLAASAYQGITGDVKEWVKIYLLARIAGAPYNTMTGQQLIALAQPLQGITGPDLQKQVEIALLGVIAVEV